MDERRQPVTFRPIRGIVYCTHEGKKLTARLDSAAIGPLIAWWNQLQWSCMTSTIEDLAQRRRSKVTFIELAIDFFLTTGYLPANRQHPLATQAKALGKALRQISKDFGLLIDYRRCSFQQAFGPSKVNSLQPLLAASSLDDVRPTLKIDHVKATWDAILAASSRCVPATPRYVLAEPTHGPCFFGHTSTARHGGRIPWWHRAVEGDGESVQAGSTLCHACYLALRRRARELARGPADSARPPNIASLARSNDSC